jgi:hypothetical protein
MIRYYTLLFLLLPLRSQAKTDRIKVKEYYKYINCAELAIIDSNYEAAGNYYHTAFTFKYPNGKDLYNAFLIAYYRTDSLSAKKYFNELAYKGMSKSTFLDTLANYPFYHFISAQYDSCYYAGSKSKMALLGAILIDIFKSDQLVRQKSLENPEGLDEDDIRKMEITDSLNVARLKKYILTYGFPSFEQKGFWDGSSVGMEGPLWYVLWHNRPYATTIDSLAKEAVLDGSFRPDDWGSIIMARLDADSYNYHMKLWKPLPSEKEVSAINKSRSTIYLEALEDYHKKFDATQKNVERARSEFNPNLYSPNRQYERLFIFLNPFLVPTKEQIQAGLQ